MARRFIQTANSQTEEEKLMVTPKREQCRALVKTVTINVGNFSVT
jgi:hypothetical protein